jgi:CBS domain-containing protein
MIPKDKIVTCTEKDTLGSVCDKLLDNHISAVVVVSGDKAVGIVTKTDVTRAYKKGYALDKTVDSIMSTEPKTVSRAAPHDEASKTFVNNKIHHAVVIDDDGTFVGVISAWDVAREGYLDAKAWPWNRHALA